MIATYPAETRDEEILLPAMEDRIQKECNDAQLAEFFWKLNDVISKDSTAQMSFLMNMAQKRAQELPVSQE